MKDTKTNEKAVEETTEVVASAEAVATEEVEERNLETKATGLRLERRAFELKGNECFDYYVRVKLSCRNGKTREEQASVKAREKNGKVTYSAMDYIFENSDAVYLKVSALFFCVFGVSMRKFLQHPLNRRSA